MCHKERRIFACRHSLNEAGYRPCRWTRIDPSQVCDDGIVVVDVEYQEFCPQLHCHQARMLQKEREERRQWEERERQRDEKARTKRDEILEAARQRRLKREEEKRYALSSKQEEEKNRQGNA